MDHGLNVLYQLFLERLHLGKDFLHGVAELKNLYVKLVEHVRLVGRIARGLRIVMVRVAFLLGSR